MGHMSGWNKAGDILTNTVQSATNNINCRLEGSNLVCIADGNWSADVVWLGA